MLQNDEELHEVFSELSKEERKWAIKYIAKNVGMMDSGVILAFETLNQPRSKVMILMRQLALPIAKDLARNSTFGASLLLTQNMHARANEVSEPQIALEIYTRSSGLSFHLVPNWPLLERTAKNFTSKSAIFWPTAQHNYYFHLFDGFLCAKLLSLVPSDLEEFPMESQELFDNRHDRNFVKDNPTLKSFYQEFIAVAETKVGLSTQRTFQNFKDMLDAMIG